MEMKLHIHVLKAWKNITQNLHTRFSKIFFSFMLSTLKFAAQLGIKIYWTTEQP